MRAQDHRSTAWKLTQQMGPWQGQLCPQEEGKHSLPTCFPSVFLLTADLAYSYPGFGSQVPLQISNDCKAMEEHKSKSNTLAQLCLA